MVCIMLKNCSPVDKDSEYEIENKKQQAKHGFYSRWELGTCSNHIDFILSIHVHTVQKNTNTIAHYTH